MGTTLFTQYLSAWQTHADGKEETTNAMITAANPEVTYDDINVDKPWVGAEGLRNMNGIAEQSFSSLTMNVLHQISDQHHWSIVWEAEGIHAPTNKPVTFRGASFGSFDSDGRVKSHTDFWSPGLLAGQLES
ncbi:hypothetical protein OPAG_06913 [Rhodococcus opacus PD630]|uniref:nuclear transport factor 2 family protein n=1 Tax=Rhodococcus opacus TaxID=37919 RepID=UPI00029CBD03|nr:nuclear transport factor 2 family protein [Rhodococcus opacus]AHK36128.1 hypothetical protein Pd630_LPD16169 [Rhodococcus opacus PD630]EHI43625.1 hypothetical protein OPAG_06913 [Rhodococcus opacus PD630]UDH01250.1 nuclear transport factor 2 family protein [Rhodococcus opacus PD630]